ncbi:unnamed protein product [Timema podura]|uniref:Uncharacterized protein n=1 Tax=Timema podura TaxID=61482 RepID=A0ABN7NPB7_TIMPD|nr:unnamed protein product [Timema podura]
MSYPYPIAPLDATVKYQLETGHRILYAYRSHECVRDKGPARLTSAWAACCVLGDKEFLMSPLGEEVAAVYEKEEGFLAERKGDVAGYKRLLFYVSGLSQFHRYGRKSRCPRPYHLYLEGIRLAQGPKIEFCTGHPQCRSIPSVRSYFSGYILSAAVFALLDDLGGYLSPGSPLPLDNTALVTQLLLVNGAPLFDLYMDRDLTNRSVLAVYLDLPRRYGHTTRLLHRPRSDIELTESSYVKWQSSLPRTGDSRHRRGSSKESRAYTYMKDRAEEKRLMEIEELLRHFLPFNMPSELKAKEAHGILLFASMLSKFGLWLGGTRGEMDERRDARKKGYDNLFPREKDIINRSQQTDIYKTFNISQLQQTYGFVSTSTELFLDTSIVKSLMY